MMNGMMGCGAGMGMMGAGLLFFILLLLVIGYVGYRIGQGRPGSASRGSESGDQALEVARRRYAQGEIDREEFERLRRDLS